MPESSNSTESGGNGHAAGSAVGGSASGAAGGAAGGTTPVAPVPTFERRSSPERRAPRRIQRSGRSWVRRTFAPDRIINGLRNLLWVAPLTVLIWIYAEREQSFKQPDVAIPIEVTTNDPNWVVTLQRPSDPSVIASLAGPKAQVDSVINDIHNLDPRFGSGPVRIEVNKNIGPGEQRIDASRIGNDPRFISHGVTVMDCRPAWLDVYLDPIVQEELEVRAVNKPVNVGAVTFNPRTVKVRGPRKVLEAARRADQWFAQADISGRPEVAKLIAEPSEQRSVTLQDVKVTLPFDSRNVTILDGGVVQATVSLKPDQDLTLPYAIPVEVVASSAVLDHNRVNYEDWKALPNVVVEGPESALEQLKNREFNPTARFEVTLRDVAAGDTPQTKQVEFKLPPGVRYRSGPNSVTFTVTHRPGE